MSKFKLNTKKFIKSATISVFTKSMKNQIMDFDIMISNIGYCLIIMFCKVPNCFSVEIFKEASVKTLLAKVQDTYAQNEIFLFSPFLITINKIKISKIKLTI